MQIGIGVVANVMFHTPKKPTIIIAQDVAMIYASHVQKYNFSFTILII